LETYSLNGTWNVSSTDEKYQLQTEAPGSLFHSLEQRGEFGKEGVFYRENNRACLDIADRDFLYSREFTLEESFLERSNRRVYLEADGLDTLAEIRVNDRVLGTTDNMHRRYRFDAGSMLRPGSNRIEILFKNSLEYIRKEKERRDIFAADNDGATSVEGFNMIRKSHCSYGWDWGPMIPDVGIWRDIRLSAYDGVRLSSVHVVQDHSEGQVSLRLHPEIEQWADRQRTLRTTITAPDGKKQSVSFPLDGEMIIPIENPQLWWPHGLGDQALYTLDFELTDEDGGSDTFSLTIGLRSMTVEQKPDQWGETFHFLVNGIPVFAKGADYIPEDVYLSRVTPDKTEKLIRDCAEANYNSLRVWGGGVYPEDTFFELCDKYGMIVWQDMMFACATYDVRNDEFLENISLEVEDNLRRIRHHPCIGLVCGNNEMEWGYLGWFTPTNEQKTEYLKQYQFVFPEIANRVCPELFYWPSSPSSGGDFERPNDPDEGDCHFWDVWHGNMPFSEYKNHFFRFMSEFGFESFPSMKTVRSFTNEKDLNIFSPVMEDHQRCPGGNGKILTYISKYFRYPKDLDSLVYVSQLSQAEAIRSGVEHWRRNRGRCMGAVYWQLNDNWPVASWSSIDYYGRWKALHYVARRMFANVLVSCDGDETGVAFHLSNEGKDATSGTFSWKLLTLDGAVLKEDTTTASAEPFSSGLILSIDFKEELRRNGDRDRWVCFEYTDIHGEVYRGTHFFAPFKSLNLRNPQISWTAVEQGDRIEITLTSARPAVYVELDLVDTDGRFSDNYFDLRGGESRTVELSEASVSLDQLESQLRVCSLKDTFV
jgi:beta-mannosidase